MSRLNNFVVNISTLTTAVKQRGFGLMLIMDDTKDHPYTLYDDISALAEDFPAGSRTYKIASSVLGQSPAMNQIAVAGKDLTGSTAVEDDIVSYLNEVVNVNSDWFALASTRNDIGSVTAISNWVDTQDKVYAVTTQDVSDVSKLESENTFIGFHHDDEMFLAESALAYMLVRTIGGITVKFKQLQGILEADIRATQLSELHSNNGFTYIRDMGVLQVTNSRCSNGEALDVVLGKYFIKFKMEEELVSLAVNTGKIPYTNEGIAMLIDKAKLVLNLATNNGIIARKEDGAGMYKVEYLDRADVPTNDVANRVYNYVKWTATLAGAIESAVINGTLQLDQVE